jgi:hypothetical protein
LTILCLSGVSVDMVRQLFKESRVQIPTWLHKPAVVLAIALAGGCATEAPPQSAVPSRPGDNYVPTQAPPKPLPESATNPPEGPGPYNDVSILQQRLPQEQEFLDAYSKVNQPRIVVYVNRGLGGQVIPPNPGGPVDIEEHTQSSTGAVTANNSQYDEHEDAYGRAVQQGRANFQSNGPAEYTETITHYAPPSDSDEADARSLDYDAVEKILGDWMSCGGRVHLISSGYLATQLSPEDMEAMSQGKPPALNSLSQKVGADVLIQVQAHPTHQAGPLQIRLVAEAMNIRGGDLLATAVVDVPLPLDKPEINTYTRFIAAKLMDGMAAAWDAYATNPPPNQPPPPPPPPPPSTSARPPLPPVPPAPNSAPPASQPTEQLNFIP